MIIFPPNPQVDDEFNAPNNQVYRWDGDVWLKVSFGNVADFLLKTGDTMEGELVLQTVTNHPRSAVNREWVEGLASGSLYQGSWEVGPNIPDLRGALYNHGSRFVCVTANPIVPEPAPGGIPGLSGLLISNGSQILWDGPRNQWDLIVSPLGSGLTQDLADIRYLRQIGGTLTGELVFQNDNQGITFNSAAWMRKVSGTGLVIRKPSGNQALQIEDNNGTNRRNIIDQTLGDARYLLRSELGVTGDKGLAFALWMRYNFHASVPNGNNPGVPQANANGYYNQDGSYNGTIYLPANGYVGNGEPFYFWRTSGLSVTIVNTRTSMASNFGQANSTIVIFIWNGATNLYDFVAQVPISSLPAQHKNNSLAHSYRMPVNRGSNGQVPIISGNGDVNWGANIILLEERIAKLEARLERPKLAKVRR